MANPDDYDGMETGDLFIPGEQYEMDQADEYRLDAEDDARNTAEVEAEERTEDTDV